MRYVKRLIMLLLVGLSIGVFSRMLYLRSPTWRRILDSIHPDEYSAGGVASGLIASINPGLSEALAGLATSYEFGEGLLGDSPVHELTWYLPYYALSVVIALGIRRHFYQHLPGH